MSVIIEALTAANTHRLNTLSDDVFDQPIHQASLTAFVEDERHLMFLAVDEGRVVGMASAVEYFHPDKPAQLWINELGVAGSHRRRGIGRQLVQALLAAGKQRGCAAAWLGTDADNAAAQACFASVTGAQSPEPFLLYEWHLE